jgi:hypothetical protein
MRLILGQSRVCSISTGCRCEIGTVKLFFTNILSSLESAIKTRFCWCLDIVRDVLGLSLGDRSGELELLSFHVHFFVSILVAVNEVGTYSLENIGSDGCRKLNPLSYLLHFRVGICEAVHETSTYSLQNVRSDWCRKLDPRGFLVHFGVGVRVAVKEASTNSLEHVGSDWGRKLDPLGFLVHFGVGVCVSVHEVTTNCFSHSRLVFDLSFSLTFSFVECHDQESFSFLIITVFNALA